MCLPTILVLSSLIRSDPGFVSPIRSDPSFVSPIRSGPVRSGFCQRPFIVSKQVLLLASSWRLNGHKNVWLFPRKHNIVQTTYAIFIDKFLISQIWLIDSRLINTLGATTEYRAIFEVI